MIESAENQVDEVPKELEDYTDFLTIAARAHEQSTSFLDSSHMKRWRKNYQLAQSEHPEGSRYLSAAYQNRARHFRGKTEGSIRKNEAAMAVALFSNHDVVTVAPKNDKSPERLVHAKSLHELTNHFLDMSAMWFKTSLGAYHEAMICGNVISKNWWKYDRDENGIVYEDRPTIDLVPLSNVKISPNADWIDPIHSSPFVILEIPMFIGDIIARMEVDWLTLTKEELAATDVRFRENDIKQARKGKDRGAAEEAHRSAITEFDYIYVHENFIRKDGQDWYYYTAGKTKLLSEPIPVEEAFPHLKPRRRPLTLGTVTIEPHEVYNRSMVDRVANAQNLANEIGNLRVDNVRQVLNKRKYVQRYAGVDYQALKTSVPGGMVLMDDINAVKPEDTIDVTSSSYQEQAVVNSDFDEMSGTFSSASVADNRQLNETVGGMQLLQGNANSMTEYQLMVFVQTWVEPVIRDMVDMVAFYTDDATIQDVLGDPNITSELLQMPVTVRADVGFGATDANGRVQKLLLGINTIMGLPGMAQSLAGKGSVEIAKEVWSVLGYNDGNKFMPTEDEDPRIQELMAKLQEMQQIIQTEQVKAQANLQLEDKRGQNRMVETVIKTTADRQVKMTEMALNRGLKLAELEEKTGVDSGNLNLNYLKEINRRMDIANQQKELEYKMTTGNDGI